MPAMPVLLAWLGAVNVATAAAYAYDKVAAPRRWRRVRERTLWLMCAAGGVAGAWVVFLGMCHKTRHRSFWVVQAVASAAWLVVVVAVATG